MEAQILSDLSFLSLESSSPEDEETVIQSLMNIADLASENTSNKQIIIHKGDGVPVLLRFMASSHQDVREHTCRALFNLTIDTVSQRYIVDREGIPLLIRNLLSRCVNIQVYAAGTLANVATNKKAKTLIARCGGLLPLIMLLSSSNELVQRQACRALFALAVCESLKGEIVNSGALKPLIHLMKSIRSELIVNHACGTLANLAVHPPNKVLIVEEGALPVVISLAQSSSVRIQKQAARVLFNLASSPSIRDEIVKQEGVSPLVILCESSDTSVQRNAIGAIANIALSDEHKESIVDHDGIPILTQLLHSSSRKPAVQRQVARALFTLSARCSIRAVIIRSGALSPMIRLLKSKDIATHFPAAGFIANLSVEADYCMDIVSSGALPPLLSLISSVSIKVQQQATRAIYYISTNSETHKQIVGLDGINRILNVLKKHPVAIQFFSSLSLSSSVLHPPPSSSSSFLSPSSPTSSSTLSSQENESGEIGGSTHDPSLSLSSTSSSTIQNTSSASPSAPSSFTIDPTRKTSKEREKGKSKQYDPSLIIQQALSTRDTASGSGSSYINPVLSLSSAQSTSFKYLTKSLDQLVSTSLSLPQFVSSNGLELMVLFCLSPYIEEALRPPSSSILHQVGISCPIRHSRCILPQTDFRRLVDNDVFSDVVFDVRGKRIYAHRAIVSVRCPVLADVIDECESVAEKRKEDMERESEKERERENEMKKEKRDQGDVDTESEKEREREREKDNEKSEDIISDIFHSLSLSDEISGLDAFDSDEDVEDHILVPITHTSYAAFWSLLHYLYTDYPSVSSLSSPSLLRELTTLSYFYHLPHLQRICQLRKTDEAAHLRGALTSSPLIMNTPSPTAPVSSRAPLPPESEYEKEREEEREREKERERESEREREKISPSKYGRRRSQVHHFIAPSPSAASSYTDQFTFSQYSHPSTTLSRLTPDVDTMMEERKKDNERESERERERENSQEKDEVEEKERERENDTPPLFSSSTTSLRVKSSDSDGSSAYLIPRGSSHSLALSTTSETSRSDSPVVFVPIRSPHANSSLPFPPPQLQTTNDGESDSGSGSTSRSSSNGKEKGKKKERKSVREREKQNTTNIDLNSLSTFSRDLLLLYDDQKYGDIAFLVGFDEGSSDGDSLSLSFSPPHSSSSPPFPSNTSSTSPPSHIPSLSLRPGAISSSSSSSSSPPGTSDPLLHDPLGLTADSLLFSNRALRQRERKFRRDQVYGRPRRSTTHTAIYSHKAILCARCEYFDAMLISSRMAEARGGGGGRERESERESDAHMSHIALPPDVSHSTWLLFLEYLYTGNVSWNLVETPDKIFKTDQVLIDPLSPSSSFSSLSHSSPASLPLPSTDVPTTLFSNGSAAVAENKKEETIGREEREGEGKGRDGFKQVKKRKKERRRRKRDIIMRAANNVLNHALTALSLKPKDRSQSASSAKGQNDTGKGRERKGRRSGGNGSGKKQRERERSEGKERESDLNHLGVISRGQSAPAQFSQSHSSSTALPLPSPSLSSSSSPPLPPHPSSTPSSSSPSSSLPTDQKASYEETLRKMRIVFGLMRLANRYTLHSLDFACQVHLSFLLTPDTVLDSLIVAEKYQAAYLRTQCLKYVLENLSTIRRLYRGEWEKIPEWIKEEVKEKSKTWGYSGSTDLGLSRLLVGYECSLM